MQGMWGRVLNRKTGLVVVACVAAYLAAGAYMEMQLVQLIQQPEPKEPQPIVWRGHHFGNIHVMEVYQLDEWRSRLFPWAPAVPATAAIIMLAGLCGFLGGMARLIMPGNPSPNSPLQGLAAGIALLALTVASDSAMIESEWHYRLWAVAGVTFLAGIVSETVWKRIIHTASDSITR